MLQGCMSSMAALHAGATGLWRDAVENVVVCVVGMCNAPIESSRWDGVGTVWRGRRNVFRSFTTTVLYPDTPQTSA